MGITNPSHQRRSVDKEGTLILDKQGTLQMTGQGYPYLARITPVPVWLIAILLLFQHTRQCSHRSHEHERSLISFEAKCIFPKVLVATWNDCNCDCAAKLECGKNSTLYFTDTIEIDRWLITSTMTLSTPSQLVSWVLLCNSRNLELRVVIRADTGRVPHDNSDIQW